MSVRLFRIYRTMTGWGDQLRMTITIDDELFEEAQRLSGLDNKGDVVREGLRVLVQIEHERSIANLGGAVSDLEQIPNKLSESVSAKTGKHPLSGIGGTQPDLEYIPRRRSEPA